MSDIKKIKLVPLISLDTKSQLIVREIRNEKEVRKWMHTDHLITLNEHLGWVNKLKKDSRQVVFVAIDELNYPLGVVSLNAIDNTHKKADLGCYLSKTSRGGLGTALEYAFIDFVFNSLNIEKLNCEVIEGNDISIKLKKKLLFKYEGFRESNIYKNNIRIGIHFLGLTKKSWNNDSKSVMDKYSKVLNKFNIEIEYKELEK